MTDSTYVLGVSMSNHDRSACLLADGRLVAAVAEERLDRRKSSEGFYRRAGRGIVLPPMRAITSVLRERGLALDDVDLVVCGRSITECRQAFLDHVPVSPDRVVEPPLPSHHLAHAYSAYATSPFADAAVLVIDEQGHWDGDRFERCTWFAGTGGDPLRPLRRFWGGTRSLSIGMFYNAFAALTGLAEAGRPAAGKLMSLAALGRDRPDWRDLLQLSLSGDVGCELGALDDFMALAGVPVRPGMHGLPVRELDHLLTKYRSVGWRNELGADLARKAQQELERAVLHTAGQLRTESGMTSLAYAGGVALNCTVNARLREIGWNDVHVHPAATDDGTAVGLAYYGWLEVLGGRHAATRHFSPLLGPSYRDEDVRRPIADYGLDDRSVDDADGRRAAELVAEGAILCWYDGRSEWGPRALGARSIVASPLVAGITARINGTVKHREPFRPFGLSVLADRADEVLERSTAPAGLDAYMLAVGRSRHPGLSSMAHVDGTVRYQLVRRSDQRRWYELIEAVGRRTGLPAVINTSFNTLGEPLVESPADAVRQFLLSSADALWMQGTLLVAAEIPLAQRQRARARAWEQSRLNPVAVAAGLAAAGHAEAAQAILTEHVVDEAAIVADGYDSGRAYYSLRQRLAAESGRPEVAGENARSVLSWWYAPPEVIAAAAELARSDGHEDLASERLIARLLAALGADRSMAEFLAALLPAHLPSAPDRSAQPPTADEGEGAGRCPYEERSGPTVAERPAIVWSETSESWQVRGFRAAREVMLRSEVFSTDAYRDAHPDVTDIQRFLAAQPAKHRRLRRALTHAFAASRIPMLDRSILEPAAAGQLDRLPDSGSVDLQRRYVEPYFRQVVFGLVGVPADVGNRLVAMVSVVHRLFSEKDATAAAAAQRLLRDFAHEVLRPGTSSPGSSLLGLATEEEWLDDGLDMDDLRCLVLPLFEAVAVKMHRDVTATLLRRIAAMDEPAQRDLVRTGAYEATVRESLRLQEGLVLPRTVREDVMLAGSRLRVGDRLQIILGDVARDPEIFPEPERFDPGRVESTKALLFGTGIHRCAGETIAIAIAARAGRSLLARSRPRLTHVDEKSFTVHLSPW